MICPCENQSREECDICRDTDTMEKGKERMKKENIEWIKIKCPKCCKSRNYTKTISGKTPCDNPRCTNLLNVGRIND